jgi:CheY-like chemotaxis protein
MLKIMLVEDDNNLREIYEARLQAEGYTVVSARDGEEGLVVAKSEKPDLLIADVMMPKISGFEMLDILRNTDGLKEVKVIMLTALGQSDDQERADSLGADRYLVKSQVTLEDIIKATHELLEDAPAPTVAATEPVLYIATPALAETQPIVPISEVFKSEVIEQSPAIEQPAMPQTTSQEQDELKKLRALLVEYRPKLRNLKSQHQL